MLERGRAVRHDVVAAQARRVAATDDGAVHRANKRHSHCSQRREASEGATQRRSSRGERCATLVRVWVATR